MSKLSQKFGDLLASSQSTQTNALAPTVDPMDEEKLKELRQSWQMVCSACSLAERSGVPVERPLCLFVAPIKLRFNYHFTGNKVPVQNLVWRRRKKRECVKKRSGPSRICKQYAGSFFSQVRWHYYQLIFKSMASPLYLWP